MSQDLATGRWAYNLLIYFLRLESKGLTRIFDWGQVFVELPPQLVKCCHGDGNDNVDIHRIDDTTLEQSDLNECGYLS